MLETYRNYVYPWQCDNMGHMNTQFYAAAFDAAAMNLLCRIAPMEALNEAGSGWADVRQLIEYKAEVRSGSAIAVRSEIEKVGKSSITVLHSLGIGDWTLAATSQTTTVLFDLRARGSKPLDENLRRAVEALRG